MPGETIPRTGPNRPRAVLLDALGTLLELEPPAEPLRRVLEERLGVSLSSEEADRAIAAEIAYYRAHHGEGRDEASTAALRDRCAAVLKEALPAAARDLPLAAVRDALLDALTFRPYPEARAALVSLRAAGRRLVVVSNWDWSLHGVLARAGLAELLDGAVTSAEAGAAKPAPEPFARALSLAGVSAAEALHAGNSLEEDVAGARAAGIAAVLVDRVAALAPPPGVPVVASLRELADLAA